MNKENLQRMADYIRTIPQEKFDMGLWRNGQEYEPECDSVGCVIGHCTVLDAENIENFIGFRDRIDFAKWSQFFTGIDADSAAWYWCFDGDWHYRDNTPEGAARRIEWLIKNGVPEDWKSQMICESALCYYEPD